jgi:hypothetical protein
LTIDDLPLPVVTFLNVLGISWPYLNENSLSEYATLVREFGQAVETTHQDAARSIAGVAADPAGHRQVDYTDLSEAAEAVQTARLLMRILDRVEDRPLAVARGAARPAS